MGARPSVITRIYPGSVLRQRRAALASAGVRILGAPGTILRGRARQTFGESRRRLLTHKFFRQAPQKILEQYSQQIARETEAST